MSKTKKINLIGLAWPINLLQCSRQIDTMQPGNKLAISLSDKDVKDSLIQFLQALPDVSFKVSNAGRGYTIKVVKHKGGNPYKAAT